MGTLTRDGFKFQLDNYSGTQLMYGDSKFVVQFTTTGSKSWNIQAILVLEMFHFYTP